MSSNFLFHAFGHSFITAKHPTTIEFTKESSVTPRGDCIVGVRADFDALKLRKFLTADKLLIEICAQGICDKFTAIPHKTFCDEKELVIRTTDFVSDRTFATKSEKAANDLSRKLVSYCKNPQEKISVTITPIPSSDGLSANN